MVPSNGCLQRFCPVLHLFSMKENDLLHDAFPASSLTIALWLMKPDKWISTWLQVPTYLPVFMSFAEKNKVFLNRMSPLWKYFLTYTQGQFISPLFCGMFQADTAHSLRGLLQLQYFQVFIYCEIWLARLDEFLWDTAAAIFNDEKLFHSLLNPFADMAYHFTRA